MDRVGLIMFYNEPLSELMGAAPTITDLLMGPLTEALTAAAQNSLEYGGVVRFQVFQLDNAEVLFEISLDCKKPFSEIVKFQY